MHKIIEIIHELNEQNESWGNYFEDENIYIIRLSNESYQDDTKKLILQLLSDILNKQKQLVDEHKEEEEENLWKEIAKAVGSEAIAKAMRETNDSAKEMYRNVRPLREAKDNIIPLIIAVFEHLSARYTPDFFQMCDKYGIASERDFKAIVLQLDRIVSVHVRRHYDKQTVYKEFMKATGFESQYALVYAELYEQYLEKIQHNWCIDKLEELTMRLEQLTEEVYKLSEKIHN